MGTCWAAPDWAPAGSAARVQRNQTTKTPIMPPPPTSPAMKTKAKEGSCGEGVDAGSAAGEDVASGDDVANVAEGVTEADGEGVTNVFAEGIAKADGVAVAVAVVDAEDVAEAMGEGRISGTGPSTDGKVDGVSPTLEEDPYPSWPRLPRPKARTEPSVSSTRL